MIGYSVMNPVNPYNLINSWIRTNYQMQCAHELISAIRPLIIIIDYNQYRQL